MEYLRSPYLYSIDIEFQNVQIYSTNSISRHIYVKNHKAAEEHISFPEQIYSLQYDFFNR